MKGADMCKEKVRFTTEFAERLNKRKKLLSEWG